MTDKHICWYSFKWQAYSNPISSPVYHLSFPVCARMVDTPTYLYSSWSVGHSSKRVTSGGLCNWTMRLSSHGTELSSWIYTHNCALRQYLMPYHTVVRAHRWGTTPYQSCETLPLLSTLLHLCWPCPTYIGLSRVRSKQYRYVPYVAVDALAH